ncbi:ceramide synthase 5-like [Watersipora subatra]|uniref:ceramide synthase 5-like n=1 Tax=Watersipora subatra TaxID=2589382 RepID=UPI00355C2345
MEMFFSESFWIPKGFTWKDYENNAEDGIYIPQTKDLLYCIPTAIVVFVVRKLFERFIAYPYGLYRNISTKVHRCTPNAQLESLYKRHPNPTEAQLNTFNRETNIPVRSIQRWLRRRRNQSRPTAMAKFTETAWRGTYYLAILIYGLVVLWDKPWFKEPKQCWLDNFPRQHTPDSIFWYYMISLGFYLTLLFSQFVDVKRKDFWEQFIHHLTTIFLMTFSWMCNFTRVGSLVLCIHDMVDWMLEFAKLNRYLNNTRLCDFLFGLFTISWFITRLVMFPYFILYTTSVDASKIFGEAGFYYFFNALLWVLQILHVIWFYIIFSAAYKAVIVGQVERDVRSCSEESGISDEELKERTDLLQSSSENVKPHVD